MTLLLCQSTATALPLRDASVHAVCTSPPYFALRSYGCGPGELGSEATPDAYIANMAQVFREVKRVLHPMGTIWINMGDSYNSARGGESGNLPAHTPIYQRGEIVYRGAASGLKPKNLLGMPWRLAFALQNDGWILRSEIIWHKVNPMPESVQDRPTRSHEQIFLFSKQAHYHYDAEAVREPAQDWGMRDRTSFKPNTEGIRAPGHPPHHGLTNANHAATGRSLRSVWPLASEPTPYAHFACMPTALVRRCLLAGAPSQVCAACGAPWRRTVEHGEPTKTTTRGQQAWTQVTGQRDNCGGLPLRPITTTGFTPTCPCAAGTQPATVLDPFCGSGTTLLVARELGHHAVGVDLSWKYLSTIACARLGLTALHEWEHGQAPQPVDYTTLPLFAGGRDV